MLGPGKVYCVAAVPWEVCCDLETTQARMAGHAAAFSRPVICIALVNAQSIYPYIANVKRAGDSNGVLESLRQIVPRNTRFTILDIGPCSRWHLTLPSRVGSPAVRECKVAAE